MNLVLFQSDELNTPLSANDPRAIHVVKVLGFSVGDRFDMGVIDGPRGKAQILEIDDSSMVLSFELEKTRPRLFPVTLLVGTPRPQTARRILREATTLGVEAIWFCGTEKGVGSYANSRLWTSDEYKRHLLDGAQQAFCTAIPNIRFFDDVAEAIKEVEGDTSKIALDNYEATCALSAHSSNTEKSILAIGPERGWSGPERDLFRENGFVLANLGQRVLRTETACIVGLGVLLFA